MYELCRAVMTIFKYTADTVYEQHSVRVIRDSFLSRGQETRHLFLCDSTNMFQFWDALNRGGGAKGGEVGSCQS